MKKIMKKMLSVVMVAAVALGLGFTPAKAAGEIIVHVEKPADFADTVNLYSWNDAGELLGGWPGTAMTTDADGFLTGTVPADTANIIFNDGAVQTVDMTAVAAGEYWFTAGTKGDDGKFTFTQSTTNPNAAAATETATTDDAAATTTEPATGDATPVVLVSLIGLAAVAVFAASKKRSIA